jgi:hypothetical protein
MGKGLREFNRSDAVFSTTFVPRVCLTAFLTSGFYFFARSYRLFPCHTQFKYAMLAATLASFYLSKGIASHYVAAEEGLVLNSEDRIRELTHYHHEARRRLHNY